MAFRVRIHPLFTMSTSKRLQCPISCPPPLQCRGQCAQLSHVEFERLLLQSMDYDRPRVSVQKSRFTAGQVGYQKHSTESADALGWVQDLTSSFTNMRDRLPLAVKCSALTLRKRDLGLHCPAVKSSSLNSFLCNYQSLNRISEYTGTDEWCVPKTTFHPHYTNSECKRTPFRPRLFQGDPNTENVKLIKIVGTHFWIQTFSAIAWDRIVWRTWFQQCVN